MSPARTLRDFALTAMFFLLFGPADIRGQAPTGEVKTPPECVQCPSPQLPPAEARKKREVKVVLRTTVSTEGRCEDITVVRSVSPQLDELAMSAARTWKLRPALGPNGTPVPVHMLIEVVFNNADGHLTLDAELNGLVERLGESIRKKVKKEPVRLLMFPSALREKAATILARSPAFEVINWQEFSTLCENEGLTPAHFKSGNVIAWAANRLGADVAVLSEISLNATSVNARIMAITATDGAKVADVRAKLARHPELVKTIEDWQMPLPAKQIPAAADPEPSQPAAKNYTVGRDKVSVPKCRSCPSTTFTQAAIDAKFEGTVILKVLIDVNGRIAEFSLVQGQPFGMTQRAIEAVRQWQLDPGTKDGKPVPVWMLVEVVFRQH